MLRLYFFIVMMLSLSACASGPTPPSSPTALTVAVVESPDASLSVRLYQRMMQRAANQLDSRQLDVYDFRRTSLDDFSSPTAASTDDAVQLARRYPGISLDYVLVLLPETSTRATATMQYLQGELQARLVDVRSGRVLATSSARRERNLGQACDSDCRETALSPLFDTLLDEVVDDIAQHSGFDTLPIPPVKQQEEQDVRAWDLVLKGFTAQQQQALRPYLSIFSGYKSMTPMKDMGDQVHVVYRTTSAASKLYSNMQRMLSELGLEGTVVMLSDTKMVVSLTPSQRSLGSTHPADLHTWE